MDVDRILAGVPEPATAARLVQWVGNVRSRLTAEQRTAIDRWFNDVPLDSGAQNAFRANQLDIDTLSRLAHRLGRREREPVRLGEKAAPIARVLESARERPTVASTIVWHLLGSTEPELASHLIQSIRERAGLPGIRQRIERAEIPSKPDISWFDDRQMEDAAVWAENIPAPIATTLAGTIERVEEQRASANVQITSLVPFLRRVASFVLTLSKGGLDPLGFALSPNAQLVADPPLSKRIEVATWSRSVGRTMSLRGQMLIASIDVASPWPLVLEVIASDLGRGASGAFGIAMRLRGEAALPPTPQPAPLLLCIPGEPIELLGARFERWSQRAYPHAVDAWRGFA